jgi:elongation factor G
MEQKAILWEDDLGKEPKVVEIPDDVKAQAKEARSYMVERIAELDDELTVRYLEGQEISIPEMKSALRQAVIDNRANAVFCGSSLKNKGVQILLDAVVDYLPSPAEVPAVHGIDDDGNDVELPPDDDAPLSALVFKIVTDPYVGRLAYFRVYSGVISQGQMVNNSTKGRRERIGRLIRMHADRREDITEVRAGDIGAVLGL